MFFAGHYFSLRGLFWNLKLSSCNAYFEVDQEESCYAAHPCHQRASANCAAPGFRNSLNYNKYLFVNCVVYFFLQITSMSLITNLRSILVHTWNLSRDSQDSLVWKLLGSGIFLSRINEKKYSFCVIRRCQPRVKNLTICSKQINKYPPFSLPPKKCCDFRG